ncbi:MAG: S9 family peptidase [Flavobacteriales bacterium]|nr:S9 family peptidase [Flavobacteriales bacterium]
MRKICVFICIVSIFTSCDNQNETEKSAEQKLKYPEVRKDSIFDTLFNTVIPDPYRWLEDDNSEETSKWVHAQNQVTFSYLEKIPFRNKLKEQYTQLWNFEKQSAPTIKRNYFFYFKNDGLQNQSVWYFKKGEKGEEKILLDPNILSEDGTTSISTTAITEDGKLVGYGISKAGSDWTELFFYDVENEKPLNDHIKWVKFSGISFYQNGFFYSSYGIPEKGKEFSMKNEYHKVYYHKMGTKQEDDVLIYEDKTKPLCNFYAYTTYDEKYLILSCSEGTSGNMLLIKDLTNAKSKITPLLGNFKNDNTILDHVNKKLIMLTNDGAPNKKIVAVLPGQPKHDSWTEIITEADMPINAASIIGNKIFVQYLKDVKSKIMVYELDGKLVSELPNPGNGLITGLSGERHGDIAFFSYSSYIQAPSIYKFTVSELKPDLYFVPKSSFNTNEYVSEQIFYTSKDGSKIPMFISYKKGIKKDGSTPCLLYGYGGFNISVTPGFSLPFAAFMLNGGIVAVANIRGGSEYGEDWHKAGMLLSKQNVFDDFIEAAEYLKKEKYTSTEKLAIYGRSNGGLLIGAVMTQRPDIAKVALPTVGVLDMLRYHKFTIGWAWAVEYGSSEDSVHFRNLLSYSPLHNIKQGTEYPATMVITADHDDRVVPAHSFKFISELQKKQTGNNPVLIRIDVNAGHGAGKPTSKSIEEWVDIWGYTFYNLGVTP